MPSWMEHTISRSALYELFRSRICAASPSRNVCVGLTVDEKEGPTIEETYGSMVPSPGIPRRRNHHGSLGCGSHYRWVFGPGEESDRPVAGQGEGRRKKQTPAD